MKNLLLPFLLLLSNFVFAQPKYNLPTQTQYVGNSGLAIVSASGVTISKTNPGGAHQYLKTNAANTGFEWTTIAADIDYVEDAPFASGDTGKFILGVRNDTYAVTTSTNGDYSQISVNSKGAILIATGSGETIPVTGTFWQATQPVSISGTVPVSGTFFQVTQPVSGTVAVSNFPASQAVTGTFFQATQPVSAVTLPLPSGAATSALQQNDALTNTQLRAVPVPISGTVTATPTGTQNIDVTANTIGLATESSLNLVRSYTGSIEGKTPALGQATMVNSSPVVISSNQSAIPVTLTSTTITGTTAISAASLPLPTGASTLLEQQSQTTHLATLAGTVTAARVAVSGTVALGAGAALIGKVGIDQTTPGTTNKVSIGTDGTVGITGSVAVTGTFFQATQPVSIASTVPVSGTFFQATQPVSGTFFQATQPVSSADNTASGSITAISQSVALSLNGKSGVAIQITGVWVGTLQFEGTVDGTNWVTINGVVAGTSTPGSTTTANGIIRLTPSGLAQTRITSTAWTSGTATISIRGSDATGGTFLNQSLTAGTNSIGTVQSPTITKGTQGTTGVTTQDLKDAGRNVTNLFMAAPIITTAAEVMQSLTGYKSGAAVTATVTPAVVTAGKTYRITEITLTYFNVATVGSARFTLRANTAGVAVIGSPLVWSKQIGTNGDGVSTAGHVNTVVIPIPDGLEFAAGTGIAIGIQGFGAVPTTGAIVGYGKIEISGYEY